MPSLPVLVGSALAQQPRTCELFRLFGILDAVKEQETPIPTMQQYKLPRTVPVKTWDLYEKTDGSPDRPYALVAIELDSDSVTATVCIQKDGKPTDEKEIIVSEFFLGADGAKGQSWVHPPTGGQGMNCGVQDAPNFAWKLALVLKGRSPASLLSSSSTERLPLKKPIAAPGTSGWLRWRNNALRLYGVNYRSSEIAVEERDTQPLDPEDVIARAYSGPGMRV
ncbi:hypothetical protein B0H14DRAFT_3420674 [Mycena olivaceomarginata]|nr:hypothetical protein B0H14DRAFT_3420674 [Mycena olivaceomarginata]